MRLLSPSSLELEVEQDQLWQRLGYSVPAQAPVRAQEAFQRAVEVGQRALEPKAVCGIFPIEGMTPSSVKLSARVVNKDGSTTRAKGVCFGSRELATRCRGAEELAVFIATIGPRLEEEVEQLFREEPTVALILDNYGSEAVVALARRVREAVQEYAASKGYRVGERYCPGYGDWATREQQRLFSLLDGGQIGVKLGPGSMMRPRKSYAGVLPLGPEVAEVKVDERCSCG